MPKKVAQVASAPSTEEALRRSEERYKAFIAQSTEGIWRCELEKPLPITGSISKQIDHIYQYGYLAECNDAMAQMYGFKHAKELIGARISDLLIREDEKNIEYLKKFIQSNYRLNDHESYERDRYGNIHIFQNNLVGIPEEGKILRAWGTQRDITKQKREEERQQFLENISNKLVASFDHHITLQEIAQLIVPYIADYCRIAIVDEDLHVKEITVNHTDPTKVSLAEDLYTSYKDLPQSTYGVPSLLKKGKSEIISELNDKVLQKFKTSKKVLKIVKQIGLKSYMGVPLLARGKVVGAITFSSVKPNRYYSKDDLHFAEELARRIALTLDNIRLFKEAQEELHRREKIANDLQIEKERLRLAQEAGHIGIFEWDMLTNTVNYSDELVKMYGYKPGMKSSYEYFMKRIHPEDRDWVMKEFNKQLKVSNYTEAEFRILLPDKTIRWIYAKSQVFYNKRRKPIKSVGINIDVTERMQTQINLRFLAEASKILSSSLDYETTLNNIAKLAVPQVADWFGIDLLDKNGELQQVAVHHKDTKKMKLAQELRAKYPTDIHAKTGIAQVLRSGKSEIYPIIPPEMLEAVAKDKKHLQLLQKIGFHSAMIVPLIIQKKAVGTIIFVSSETKRSFTKGDLSVAEELANRISIAMENAQLYKSAKDAISLRDDFISVASHELKTPITSVKIFTQVLQKHAEKTEDDKAVKSLAKMDKQIDKLTELVLNLLNIAKIQTGRMEYTEKPFDFDKMVMEVVDVLQHMTVKHKIIVVGKTNKKFFGDEDRIGQVISNLISNAIKYSPHADKIIVTLSAKRNHIGLSVQDFGIGMAKEHLEKIFNRFYRVSGATDKTFPGLGIGLYISHEIIKRHGGKLWAESDEGKGSTFYLSLPLVQDMKAIESAEQKLQN